MAALTLRGKLEVPFETGSPVTVVEHEGSKPLGEEVFVGMTGSIKSYTLKALGTGIFELVAIVVVEFSTPQSNLVAAVPIRFLKPASRK